MLCFAPASAQIIKSDDFFKNENQRFIQTTDQKITHKTGITASVFFGIMECSNQSDTLFSLYFSLPVKQNTSIEKGGTITLHFKDGSTVSLPDQQQAKTVRAGQNIYPNCYLTAATWKKIMEVDIKEVVISSNQKFSIRIPGSYQNVIPGMVRMLYERGRAPYVESL